MPVDPSLIAALIAANPNVPSPNTTPEALGQATEAKIAGAQAQSTAIDNYVKSLLLRVANILTTPGAFVSPMGPCSPGAIMGIFPILGAPSQPPTPIGQPDEEQIKKITEKVISKLEEKYILTPKT